jgi:O-antigen/teichoic acid export membrane protein
MKYYVYLQSIVRPTFKIVFISLLLLLGLELTGLLIGHVIAIGATIVVGSFLIGRLDFTQNVTNFQTIPISMLVGYSLPLMFSGMISATIGQIDYYLIGYYMNSADVGIYKVGFLISELILLFHTSLHQYLNHS